MLAVHLIRKNPRVFRRRRVRSVALHCYGGRIIGLSFALQRAVVALDNVGAASDGKANRRIRGSGYGDFAGRPRRSLLGSVLVARIGADRLKEVPFVLVLRRKIE